MPRRDSATSMSQAAGSASVACSIRAARGAQNQLRPPLFAELHAQLLLLKPKAPWPQARTLAVSPQRRPAPAAALACSTVSSCSALQLARPLAVGSS